MRTKGGERAPNMPGTNEPTDDSNAPPKNATQQKGHRPVLTTHEKWMHLMVTGLLGTTTEPIR